MAEIDQPFNLHKVKATVGASIGIALAPYNANDGPALMWCADVAMYRAKLGQMPYVFYDHDLDGGEDSPNLLDELREAVKQGDFVLHYQPQLDLKTGQILAVEALVRWPHATLGLVPPLKFLPLAEEAGLMWPLTQWVLNEAFTQCATWRSSGHRLAVSINVSTSDLLEPAFLKHVRELLAKHELPGEAIVIEITETTIITDFLRSQAVILELRDLDIVVSIDDFGAGFTSLAYLSSLAVGELKLDRTFITSLKRGRQWPRDGTRASDDQPRPRHGSARGRRRHRRRRDPGPLGRSGLRPRPGLLHQPSDAREPALVSTERHTRTDRSDLVGGHIMRPIRIGAASRTSRARKVSFTRDSQYRGGSESGDHGRRNLVAHTGSRRGPLLRQRPDGHSGRAELGVRERYFFLLLGIRFSHPGPHHIVTRSVHY